MESTFEYTVLRLVPDESRGERINFGIVVFLEGILDVRSFPDLAKVRALNPNLDRENLRNLGAGLNSLFGSLNGTAARHAALKRFPLIDVSDLGWFQCDKSDYELYVVELIERLVLTPAMPHRSGPTRLETKIKQAFLKCKLLASDESQINSHLVVQNFPIAKAEGLAADFALKNGRMHFTAVLDLRGSEDTLRHVKRGQAALKAMMLNRARERFQKCYRIGVYITHSSTREIVEPCLAMLKHDSDVLYDYSDKNDRAAYVEHMQEAARA